MNTLVPTLSDEFAQDARDRAEQRREEDARGGDPDHGAGWTCRCGTEYAVAFMGPCAGCFAMQTECAV